MGKDGGWIAYSGWPVCPVCGDDPASIGPAPKLPRIRAWFVDGTRSPKTEARCPKGHTWAFGQVRPPYRTRPGRFWAAIAYNRTVIPTPQSYSIAFAAGTVVGLTARAIGGWRRWWVAGPLALAASFVHASSTALRGARRAFAFAALRDQLDPGGAPARRRADSAQRMAARRFPVYGFADPPATPVTGGSGGSADLGLTSMTISYGGGPDVAGGPTRIEVQTERCDASPAASQGLERQARDFELWVAAQRAFVAGEDPGRAIARAQVRERGPRAPGFTDVLATVEGAPHEAKRLSLGEATLVVIALPDVSVVVRALRELPPLDLVAVDPPATWC